MNSLNAAMNTLDTIVGALFNPKGMTLY
jgi:hypothetical protein